MQVQDKSGGDLESLQTAAEDVVRAGNANPRLVGLFTSFRASEPQLYLEVDRSKVKNQHIALSDVFDTLQIYLGLRVRQRHHALQPQLAGQRAGGTAVSLAG